MPNVVEIRKIRHSGRLSTQGGVNGGEDIVYHVEYDGRGATLLQAYGAVGGPDGPIPLYGATSGPYVVTGKSGDFLTPLIVEVRVTTSTPPADGSSEVAPEEPDEENGDVWSIDVTIRSVTREVEIFFYPKDRDELGVNQDANGPYFLEGKPILNSAGDPVRGVMAKKHDEEIDVAYTTNLVDWTGIDACLHRVNSEDVTMYIRGQTRTFKAETLLFLDYEMNWTLDPNGTFYPRVRYKLLHRPEGWKDPVADMGVNLFDDENEVQVPIMVLDTSITPNRYRPVTEPQFLDGAGQPLPAGQDAVLLPPSDETGLRIYTARDFNILLLNFVILETPA